MRRAPRRPSRLAGLAVGALVLVPLAACGGASSVSDKASEQIAERMTGRDVDITADGKSVTIEGKDGSFSVGESVDLPTGFPPAVPTPKGATLTTAVAVDGGFSLGYTVKGSWKPTVESYYQALESAGFTRDVEFVSGEMESRSYVGPQYTVTAIGGANAAGSDGYLTVNVTPTTASDTGG